MRNIKFLHFDAPYSGGGGGAGMPPSPAHPRKMEKIICTCIPELNAESSTIAKRSSFPCPTHFFRVFFC
jgi:hypothetical protein